MGRKTKLNEDTVRILTESISLGLSYKESCTKAGISFETFNEWRKNIPEFSDLIRQSELKPKELALKSVKVGQIKDWRAGAWWLERRYPKEYKERKQVDVDLPNLVQNVFPIDDDEKS